MPFRVPVTRSLFLLLCVSLIVPWSGFSASMAAGQADPGASPAPIVIEQEVAPSPETPDSDAGVVPDLDPATDDEDVSDGSTSDTGDAGEIADPGPATGEEDGNDGLTPETDEPDGDADPAVKDEDSSEKPSPDTDASESDASPAPLSRRGTASDSGVGILAVNESVVSVTVTMADGGNLPPGMSVSVYQLDGLSLVATNVVPGGDTSATVTLLNQVPFGDYRLFVTGAGYSEAQPITVDSETESYSVSLERLPITVDLRLTTSDAGEIPAGTKLTIINRDSGLSVMSITLPGPGANGMGMSQLLGAGEYELVAEPNSSGTGRQVVVSSTPFTVASSETNAVEIPIVLEMQSVSSLTVTVTMSDDGTIPHGFSMTGEWDGFQQSFPVPGGSTSVGILISESVPYGSYEILLENGSVSSRREVIVNSPVQNSGVSLTRYEATSQITLATSDDGAIPAGTTWALTSGDVTVLSGVLAEPMASGSAFGIGPVYVGPYQFSVTPPEEGDRKFPAINEQVRMIWSIHNPFSFALDIIPVTATIGLSVAMDDGGTIPAGLHWTLYPSGSWDPIATGPVTAGGTAFSYDIPDHVPYGSYQLWITGNGYSSGQVINVQSPTVGHGFTLTRLRGTIQLTLNSSDAGDIPAGTSYTLTRGSALIESGTEYSGLPNGSEQLLGPHDFGVYELAFTPAPGSTGRQIVPQTITINMNNPWITEYDIGVNLEVFTPMSTVTVSVEMIDGGNIPAGLQWSLFPPGSWDPIATGPVTTGGTTFSHDIPEQVPYGVYQLWITGNGYSSGQVINVQSDTFHHGFPIQRLHGNLAITVTTNDGSDIPAGTAWEILDSHGTVIQNGTLLETMPSGSLLQVTNPFEFGVYTLNIGPATDALVPMALADISRDLLPFATTINVTNPWFSDYPVTAELQWAQSDVTFSVSMSDDSPLPNGLEWMLVVSGSWDPLATGTVTAGEITFAGQIQEPVPYGVYQLWITGNGYSSGQVLNIQSLTTHHDFVLDPLQAEVTVTLDTSDDADVPAGTTWLIVDSAGAPVQSGVLAEPLADGSALPLTNPLAFDVYTLVVDAEGYHPVTMELSVTNPWLSEMDFTVNLVTDRLPEPTPTEPTTPTPVPSPSPSPAPSPEPVPATPQPVTPAPDSSSDVTPAAPITGLPQTGTGGSGIAVVSMMLLAGAMIALAAGFFLRERHR